MKHLIKLAFLLLATTVWGQNVVTFIPGETTGNNETAQGADSMTKDGIAISTTSGGLKAPQYRFAKGSVTTVSSAIGNIISIEFTCSASGTEKYGPGCFASQTGYSYEGNVGTWVGSAESVEFTAESNQVRATQIVVTVGEAGLAKPTINPASGTFYAPIEVNITCGTNGAKIYYTTNGSDPSTSSTQFTAPFTVSSNTTVKAISAKDGEVSDVVSAEYTFATATPVNSIAAFQNAADGTVLVFNNPVTVLAQSGPRMFVQDNTGRALFYGDCGQTYKNGDVIPAGFVGSKTTWDGEPELQNLSSFKAATSNSPVDPATITTAQVEASRFAQYVYLEEVTFDKANKLVKDAAGQASYYCNMNVKDNDIVDGATYNLWAIVGSHGKENTVYQLLPVDLERIGGGGDLVGFGNLPSIVDNTEVTMGYEITVLGQQGSYLYAMDETGFGLIYGSAGQTYAFGDVAPGNFTGKKVTWDGEPELQSPNGLKAATRNIGANLTPNSITPAQVGHNIWGQYVVLMGVTIDTGAKTLNKNGESCTYYDRFGVEMPTDGSAYDVYGIVASYGKSPGTVYQLLPVKIERVGDGGGFSYDIEVDGIYYNITSANTVEVTYKDNNYSSYSGYVIIPSQITYNSVNYSVTAIGDSAFYNCSVDSVEIPETVTRIGIATFKNCNRLSKVTCKAIVPPVMENSFDVHNVLYSYWDSYFSGYDSFSETEIPPLILLVPEVAYGNYKTLNEENQFFNFIAYIGASKTQPPTFTVECEEDDFFNRATSCSVNISSDDEDVTIISWSWSINWNSPMDYPSETSSYYFTAPSGSAKPKHFVVYAIAVKEGCLPSDVAMQETPGLLPAPEYYYTYDSTCDFESGGVFYNYIYETDDLEVVTPYNIVSLYASEPGLGYDGPVLISQDFELNPYSGDLNISSEVEGHLVTTIGQLIGKIPSIFIPSSVTTISSGAFSECSGLQSITIDPNNTVYDSRDNCNAIIETASNSLIVGCQNTIILNSVTTIGSSAFYNCSGLASVAIPNSVTTIGGSAFSGCSDLDEVYSYITDLSSISMGSNVFYRNPANYEERTLYVPLGTSAAYQADTLWSAYFGSIVEMEYDNYLLIPDTTVFHGDTIVVPVKMFNEADVISFQTDIFLPEGLELLQEDGEYIIDPSERMTRTHSIMSDNVSNGSIRVLCYSSNYKPFTGNSGDDLFYLTLKVADDAEGDYTIQLKNTLLTNTDFVDMPAPDVAATVNVKAYILGDANNSRLVTVGDVVATAQYVLEQNPQPFNFEAADVNFDGTITVADVSRIAWMVLNPGAKAPHRAPAVLNSGDRMSGEGISLMRGETRRVSIALDNALNYSAFQLDLSLPEGLTASNFQLTDRAGSHAFDVNTLGGGNIRALCYSPALTAISGHEGALLTFDVTANSAVTGAIMVDGIELVTTACESVRLDGFAIDVNSTSGVNEQIAGKTVARVDYYNLAGQQIDRPEAGVTLVVTTYTDGTRTTAKIVR